MPAFMQAPSTPTGFIINLADPGNIVAQYGHTEGKTGVYFQCRVAAPNGIDPVATGAVIGPVSVAPGNTVHISWASSALGKLPQGRRLKVQVRARAAGEAWGAWGPGQDIKTNAPPDVPSGLSPSTGYAAPSRPKLAVTATDPDTWENPPGSLIVRAEIMEDDGVTVRYVRTMTWNVATQQYEYQLNSTDEPAYRTFNWRAYSFDSSLYSGGGETAADATRSAPQKIVYAAAPAVAITGPASPVDRYAKEITWTVADQAFYMVTVTLPDGRIAYRYGLTNTSHRSHVLGSNGWDIENAWRNGETVTVTVDVTNSLGVKGSATKALLLQYSAPGGATGFTASDASLAGTVGPNGIQITWAKTSIMEDEFYDYLIEREELDGQGETVKPGTLVYLQSIRNINTLSLRDFTVESGRFYRYGIVQRKKLGADILWSDRVALDYRVEWSGIVLHLMGAPDYHSQYAYSCEIRYGDGTWEPSTSYGKRVQLHRTLGRKRRIPRIAASSEIVKRGSFALIDDPVSGQPAKRIRDRFLTIWEGQDEGPDGRPRTICWRDGDGGLGSVVFGVFTTPPELTRDGQYANVWRLNVELEEVDLTLGVQP